MPDDFPEQPAKKAGFKGKTRGNMIKVCIRFSQAIQVQGSVEDFTTKANMRKRQVYRWIKSAEEEGILERTGDHPNQWRLRK
jgi:CTP-dependent riboflavin kinase